MNVKRIAQAIERWGGWETIVNYGGQVECFRRDYEYKIVLDEDCWELRAIQENSTDSIVTGETVEEVEIAMGVVDAIRPMRKRGAKKEPECECRFSGDRADASACELHGEGRAA